MSLQIYPAHMEHAPAAFVLELKAVPYDSRLVSYHTAMAEKAPFKSLRIINFYHCPLLLGTTSFWIPI